MKAIHKWQGFLLVIITLTSMVFAKEINWKKSWNLSDKSIEPGSGMMFAKISDQTFLVPLKKTIIKSHIKGFMNRSQVEQIFVNTSKVPIEAIYVFPLAEKSAVDAMDMYIGKRHIKAIISEKKQAIKKYQEAKQQGKTASLLLQQRPNIFQQNVANIMPGDTIKIVISYLEEIKFLDGNFRLTIPLTIGPRYNSSHHQQSAPPTPSFTTEPAQSAKVELSISIESKYPISNIQSKTHKIQMSSTKSTVLIKNQKSDQLPNKDFVLTYSLSQKDIQPVLYSFQSKSIINHDKFFQLNLIPQIQTDQTPLFNREIVFVIDNSGSMSGSPMNQAKDIMRKAILGMNSRDRFRIMTFAGYTQVMSEKALKSTPENLEKALLFTNRMRGGGGTEMMKAIHKMLSYPASDRQRIILFITDGYVGNERNIITTLKQKLGENRVFTMGVGSSPNHYLLQSIADFGRGFYQNIPYADETQVAISQFYSLIERMLIHDLKITGNGIEISEIYPEHIPDLFAGKPLLLTGKYKGHKGSITLSGKLPNGKIWKQTLQLTPNDEYSDIASLWARKKVRQLKHSTQNRYRYSSTNLNQEEIRKEITNLGLKYNIMTDYTAFIAVDQTIRNTTGFWKILRQKLLNPDGHDPKQLPPQMSAEELQAHKRSQSYNGIAKSTMSEDMNKVLAQTTLLASTGKYELGVRKGKASAGFDEGAVGGGNGGIGLGGVSGGSGGRMRGNMTGRVKLGNSSEIAWFDTEIYRSKREILRILKRKTPGLRYIFNQFFRKNPSLKGKIVLKMTIAPTGRITKITLVSSTTKHKDFDQAIINAITSRFRFKKIQSGSVSITVPFEFSK